MKIGEITARSILTKTGIPGVDYCLNPYVGCHHGCVYCYATFMKKYSGHTEPWGEFVDAKVNAPELLKRELRRPREGEVIVSSVTDCYQPVEARFKLTRACLEILAMTDLSVSILTKSNLVTRDIDIFKKMRAVDVGLTITTDREDIRRIFEPHSSTIESRIEALKTLKEQGISTHVFVGPILPMDAEKLARAVAPYADRVLIDRMNYPWKAREVYSRHNLAWALEPAYFKEVEETLRRLFSASGIEALTV
ncbi:MAG: radical SAM protein [Candidatus Eisenbacteria bacterium]